MLTFSYKSKLSKFRKIQFFPLQICKHKGDQRVPKMTKNLKIPQNHHIGVILGGESEFVVHSWFSFFGLIFVSGPLISKTGHAKRFQAKFSCGRWFSSTLIQNLRSDLGRMPIFGTIWHSVQLQ